MSARELATLARGRGLGSVAALIEGFASPELLDGDSVPADARLVEPPHTQPKSVLGQMARRGHDPALVRAVWRWLDGRPLEQSLVAVDVLARALWPAGEPLTVELRQAASRLGALRPPPGQVGLNLNEQPAASLIETFARDAALGKRATIDLLALSYDFHLGALDELGRRRDPILQKSATKESVRAFGRLLHLAHLPTLASLYLDYVSRPLGYRVAALDLCETLFDAGVAEKIPGDAIRPGDVPDADAQDVGAYLLCRSWMALGDASKGWSLCEQYVRGRLPAQGALRERLAVVRAHLGSLFHARPVALEVVMAACDRDRLWRFGARARATVTAAQLPPLSPRPLQMAHDYVTGFGNDLALWRDLVQAAPPAAVWRGDVLRLLAREAGGLPHALAPWQAIALLIGDASAVQKVGRELDGLVRAQADG